MKRMIICCDASLVPAREFGEGTVLLEGNDAMAEEAARRLMETNEITNLSIIGTPPDIARMQNNIAEVLRTKYATATRGEKQ